MFDNLDGFEMAINKVIDDNGAQQHARRPCSAADPTVTRFCSNQLRFMFHLLFLDFCLRPGQDVAMDMKEVLEVSSIFEARFCYGGTFR